VDTMMSAKHYAIVVYTCTRQLLVMYSPNEAHAVDQLETYGNEWKVKSVNEVMADLQNGKNTNNYRFSLEW
jgi:hypothetical protein